MLKNHSRISILGVGYTVEAVLYYSFDYILYPFVIWQFGILKGGVVMTFLSLLVCYSQLRFYDWSKQDWLGIEAVKTVREYNGESAFRRSLAKLLQSSRFLMFVFLSIKFDPFITTLYLREGINQFNGLSRRDWGTFLGSVLIGNVYWTLAAYFGVTVIEYIWTAFKV